ncbi:type II toxin-antitoxin system HicB family antitoxin [uncultured Thiodictyon sp.]|uniref:type II toxin-antitoxin system HicB family antitoxin n=1 Tax=uncultured Thiodictyon sp. TaxID=1846217 RepID=UPI0025CD5659|nr:type II toxin-antitoxin system HicB family antitoxin [uncultured Thiodictyon sp.]
MNFVYPVTLTPDADGGFVVTFRDWPEAITQGETRNQAMEEAADCLEEAVAARIDDRAEIPLPSPLQAGEAPVAVPIATALKAALYLGVREAGIGTSELARRLGVHEKEARRLLDPRHGSKAAALERALAAVGRRLAVEIQAAA